MRRIALTTCAWLALTGVAIAAEAEPREGPASVAGAGRSDVAASPSEAAQVDKLISVKLDSGYEQRGVLTTVKDDAPSVLVLLFPGQPGVLRAEVEDSKLVKSRLRGNPLVRARSLLVK